MHPEVFQQTVRACHALHRIGEGEHQRCANKPAQGNAPRPFSSRKIARCAGGWRRSVAACVPRAEGHSFRVALSRGVWHGAARPSTSPHLSHPPPRRSDAIHRHPLPAFTPKLNGCAATPWVSSKREGTPERAEECVPPNSVLWASLPATQGVPPRAGLFQRIWPRHGEVVSQGRDRLQSRRDTGIEIKRVARTIIDGSTSAPRNRVARTRAFPNSA